MYEWFNANGLNINPDKTHFINFHVNHNSTVQGDYSYLPATFNLVTSTNLPGLELDSSLIWRQHINSILPKLSKASKSVYHQVLRQVYFAYFHSLISHGLILWGNSGDAARVFSPNTSQQTDLRCWTSRTLHSLNHF